MNRVATLGGAAGLLRPVLGGDLGAQLTDRWARTVTIVYVRDRRFRREHSEAER